MTKSFVIACFVATFMAIAAPTFAQPRPANSKIPTLSDKAMEEVDMGTLNRDLVVKYLDVLILKKDETISPKSKEAQVAATLVSKMSAAQLATFSTKNGDSTAKAMACVGSFCTTAQCSQLNYGDMWASLGLCVE